MSTYPSAAQLENIDGMSVMVRCIACNTAVEEKDLRCVVSGRQISNGFLLLADALRSKGNSDFNLPLPPVMRREAPRWEDEVLFFANHRDMGAAKLAARPGLVQVRQRPFLG